MQKFLISFGRIAGPFLVAISAVWAFFHVWPLAFYELILGGILWIVAILLSVFSRFEVV